MPLTSVSQSICLSYHILPLSILPPSVPFYSILFSVSTYCTSFRELKSSISFPLPPFSHIHPSITPTVCLSVLSLSTSTHRAHIHACMHIPILPTVLHAFIHVMTVPWITMFCYGLWDDGSCVAFVFPTFDPWTWNHIFSYPYSTLLYSTRLDSPYRLYFSSYQRTAILSRPRNCAWSVKSKEQRR